MCIQSFTVVDLWAHDGVDCTSHEVRCILRYWYLYSSGTVVYTDIYIKVYSETLYPFSAVYSVQYIPVLLSKPAVIIDKSKSEKRCHPVINEGKKSIETQPK